MLAFDVTLDGFKRVVDRYRRYYPSTIARNFEQAKKDVGLLVQKTSRKYAPYDTGDLERSINFKVGKDYVDVYVPRNSRAGAYAYHMHYGHYQEGQKTKAKGAKAGREYIARAISDQRRKINFKFQEVFRGVRD